jgi:FkbM family methyltransferase
MVVREKAGAQGYPLRERAYDAAWGLGVRVLRCGKRLGLSGPFEETLMEIAKRVIQPPAREIEVSLPFGMRMTVPPGFARARSYASGLYESDVTALVEGSLKNGMTVVDLGAFCGYYTLLASRLVGPSGHVYAFEPDPANYAYLVRNIQANACGNVVAINKAASNRNGKAILVLEKDADHHWLSSSPCVGSGAFIEVPTLSLDAFFVGEGWPSVDLVKIDIEGSEEAALEGMRELSSRNPNMRLIMELNWPAMHRAGVGRGEMVAALTELGFSRGHIIERGLRPFSAPRALPRTRATYNVLLKRNGNGIHTDGVRTTRREGASETSEETPDCPVCASTSKPHMPVRRWGELRRCSSCGLIFAHPMDLAATPQQLFGQAYSGNEARAGMEMFHQRLAWRADLLTGGAGVSQAMAPAHRRALAHIQEAIPPGELIADIGCGSGLFLEAVSRAGYAAAGVEVAEPAVAFLSRAGYKVFHGTMEEVPEGWADPAICTSFFVLHHVSSPVDFLRAIRRKFPRAALILTEHYFGPNPKRLLNLNLPPRRLTLWNQQALRQALESAGFRVDVLEILPHEPWHPWLDGSLTQLYCRLRESIPPALRPRIIDSYLWAQHKVFGSLRALFGNRPVLGQEHLLAIASPAAETQ